MKYVIYVLQTKKNRNIRLKIVRTFLKYTLERGWTVSDFCRITSGTTSKKLVIKGLITNVKDKKFNMIWQKNFRSLDEHLAVLQRISTTKLSLVQILVVEC